MPNGVGVKLILEGRVVTMGPQGVIPDGAVYIEGAKIVEVQPAGQPAPAGFEAAQRLRTGGTIYPGLIEIHNHLAYNALPLWQVPRAFDHNMEWRGLDAYRQQISKPAQILGRTEGVIEAVVRLAECRCLFGGVTTSQGITLMSAAAIRKFFRGLVRNVEDPDHPDLPAAGTNIANPVPGGAREYLRKLEEQTCYLQHLSEGRRGSIARTWFQNLQIDGDEWAITKEFCGIHSMALEPEDFEIVADRGGSMVWSPLSNYLLYGETADVKAAKDAGVLMALGSDWAPSGSKNLLGELKVAWLASEQLGQVFTPEELVRMVTINPATILKWNALLGSVEKGKLADLVVVKGTINDPFMQLIEASESDVILVVIDGVRRYGRPGLMRSLPTRTERVMLAGKQRLLNLVQENPDPPVGLPSLTKARERIADAFERLQELAQKLDRAAALGLQAGASAATGTTWAIELEFDEADAQDLGPLEGAALAAKSLSEWVEDVHLELAGITVADDATFLPKLAASVNLPDFIKQGLPPLYGVAV